MQWGVGLVSTFWGAPESVSIPSSFLSFRKSFVCVMKSSAW